MHLKTLYTITLLCLICPDLLRVVGETSYGIQVGFIEFHIVFTISLFRVVVCTLHFGLNYELIYQLNAIEYLLCTFSSTCFGLTCPSSGAMDVTFLYIYSIWCPWCS